MAHLLSLVWWSPVLLEKEDRFFNSANLEKSGGHSFLLTTCQPKFSRYRYAKLPSSSIYDRGAMPYRYCGPTLAFAAKGARIISLEANKVNQKHFCCNEGANDFTQCKQCQPKTIVSSPFSSCYTHGNKETRVRLQSLIMHHSLISSVNPNFRRAMLYRICASVANPCYQY